MTFEELTKILLAWPHVQASSSYGTPAFKVAGKLLTRLKEDGDSIVLRGVADDERATLVAADPDAYYFTDHYRNYPIVLVRLSACDRDAVVERLRRTYLDILPAKLKSTIDASQLT